MPSPPAQTLSPVLLAFLMVGRGAHLDDESGHRPRLYAGSLDFLHALATAPETARATHAGLSTLAAWLSNRPGFVYGKNHPGQGIDEARIEAIGLELLAAGADACAGLDAWLAGHDCPDPEAPPSRHSSQSALLAHATACPLAAAFACGFVGLTEAILDQVLASRPDFMEAFDGLVCANGEPLLHAATASPPMLEMLLRKGANPHVRGAHARTALHAATNKPAAEALLRAGVEPSTTDANGLACIQVWKRLPARTTLADVLTSLKSPQPIRDALFLCNASGAVPTSADLHREGVSLDPAHLVWTGLAARLCGLTANHLLPTSRSVAWLAKSGFIDAPAGRKGFKPFCLMAMAILDDNFVSDADTRASDRRAFAELLSAMGYASDADEYSSAAQVILARECGNLPQDLAPCLDAIATAIANETGRPVAAVAKSVFDTAGAALLCTCGLGGRVASLLQASARRAALGRNEADILLEWLHVARSEEAGRSHQNVLDDVQALRLARILTDLVEKEEGSSSAPTREKDSLCEDLLPLWDDLIAWSISADAGAAAAEVGSLFDAAAEKHGTAFRAFSSKAFDDLLTLRRSAGVHRQLSSGSAPRPRLRA